MNNQFIIYMSEHNGWELVMIPGHFLFTYNTKISYLNIL